MSRAQSDPKRPDPAPDPYLGERPWWADRDSDDDGKSDDGPWHD
jgi:hypothetical protein